MRVLGVIRLSRETDETTSPERQREGLTAWATAHGHTIVGWAEDLDVSGAVPPWERPELGRWLGDSPPAPFDVIAGWKIDRISRSLLHFVQLIDWARERGKHVAAYMDSVDTSTDAGELVAKVLAIFAEFERKTIAARSADSRRKARQDGTWHGGSVAYGYRPVKNPAGKGWKLAHDPEALPILRAIVADVIDGKSTASIARGLNARGVLSPRDHAAARDGKTRVHKDGTARKPQAWTDTTVRRMLVSRALLGQLEHRGRVVRDDSGLPVQRAEPLIPEADWKALQHALDGKRRPKYRAAPTALLSGLAFCGEDGSPLHFNWMVKPERNQEYRYYRCSARAKQGLKCDAKAPRAEALEADAVGAFLAIVGDLEVMERQLVPGEDHTAELARVDQALTELRGDRAAGLYSGDRGTAEYRAMYLSLEGKRAELAELPNVPDRWDMVPTGRTFRETWDALAGPEERRAFLLSSGLRVKVHADPRPTLAAMMPGLAPEGAPLETRVSFEMPADLQRRVLEHAARLAA
ncbi:recombinase family protein [Micromonospora purpureochromogenes]|uniref:recombinase family protein n=1 Tax=Micromonospora purpureochromogenes TaxID=47872 RepID=UPI0033EBDE29